VGDRATSCILLLVSDEPRLPQVERQLEKLHDVLSVRHRPELGAESFRRLLDPVTAGP
jgi:acetolactate synthase-1/3 small subunit